MRVFVLNINKMDRVRREWFPVGLPFATREIQTLDEVLSFIGDNKTTIATPGNCLGWMKGGFDRLLYDKYGDTVEKSNREVAPIPIGSVNLVELDPLLSIAYAPTMETPREINNVFWAYLAVFRAVTTGDIVTPLFGTGFGGLSNEESARQMVSAWEVANDGDTPDSFGEWVEMEREWKR